MPIVGVDTTVHRPMPPARSRSLRPSKRLAAAAVIGCALAAATPAAAQYGGGANLTVDPVEVELDGDFSYLGTDCAGGSTVVITIDGFADILDTTTAGDDSSYTGSGVELPDGVVAGDVYTVRATCNGVENFTTITAVCNGGDLPVDGECPDGGTLGGEDPTATTTTTTTASTTTTLPGGTTGGSGSGGNGDTTGTTPDLAVTGATFAEQAAQLGATLVAIGGFVVLLARRRRDPEPVRARVR
ncbi:MAG: hypothetical protein DHS20C19_29920 [Acidimicrobiales bacterium]|nr:MAG: hypothetical protein DHS20C19_29920 [Acidimicrobiales bacterium]